MKQIRSVGIVGAGTMGQGIAQVCASAGFSVLLFDIQPSLVESAVTKISTSLQSLVEKNKISSEDRSQTIARISTVASLDALQCDLIIEAAVENLSVKHKIFSQLEASVKDEAILTSNTSSIPITQIASVLKATHRFAGLHFFNPAPVMKLVEIVKGAQTSEETVEVLKTFCHAIQKQLVIAYDSPGFIVNRVARHFYVESLKLMEENVASVPTIDALLRTSGFKMGPFELMDLIGVDVNFAVTSSMYNSFHQDPKFRPSRIQQQKVDAGHHGRKTGKGFYDYSK
ncbi:MAG TPA: 3-hydroxyacyl-CoA dehydrogenase NAD-binding domain-containing protein [Chryseosolibacter sp.]